MASVPALIRQYSRRYGVDARAALAVARTEGGLRTGAVGDQGTSYGPFQLHVGGALPRGKGAAWANSPAGIEYAIRQMAAAGARGLTGQAAINAIVRNFERPADPDSQVAKALGFYGSAGAGGSPTQGGAIYTGSETPAAPQGDPRSAFARVLLNRRTMSDPLKLVGAIKAVQSAVPSQAPASAPMPAIEFQGRHVTKEAQDAVGLVKQYLGTPYVWGGENPGGFDCSGLLQYVWGKVGVQIPRVSQAQWKAGKAVSRAGLRPGDAVFFGSRNGPGHVGMFIGNGQFIEAPRTGLKVRISQLSGRNDFIGGRRFR